MAEIQACLPSHASAPHTHLKGPTLPHSHRGQGLVPQIKHTGDLSPPQPPFLWGSCLLTGLRGQSPLRPTTALTPEPCHRGSDPQPVPSFHPTNPSLQPRCPPHVQGVK